MVVWMLSFTVSDNFGCVEISQWDAGYSITRRAAEQEKGEGDIPILYNQIFNGVRQCVS